jgi:hypothetical protein
MAREWEAEFIRRWGAGETTDAIAAALGIAEGTVSYLRRHCHNGGRGLRDDRERPLHESEVCMR